MAAELAHQPAQHRREAAGRLIRIYRSCLVGLDHVAAVGQGARQVRQETLPVSDGYREVVDAFFTRCK